MEAAGPVTVLAVLDVLYAFFLAVQCAALFGGADYLAQVGISYASYARSGFFQLVAVAAVNLACLLACLALCKGEGRGLRMVQVLGTLLVAASGVLLVSALWRMNLYVGAYGLSFKRALTYWGMAVLAVLLAAALWKVWHRHFHWFRVLLSVGVAGWLLRQCGRLGGPLQHWPRPGHRGGTLRLGRTAGGPACAGGAAGDPAGGDRAAPGGGDASGQRQVAGRPLADLVGGRLAGAVAGTKTARTAFAVRAVAPLLRGCRCRKR